MKDIIMQQEGDNSKGTLLLSLFNKPNHIEV
jgi:hypothetical protein